VFQNFSEANRNKKRHSKIFRSKDEQKKYSKAFLEQRKANEFSQKFAD